MTLADLLAWSIIVSKLALSTVLGPIALLL
jgi:hypothetical protein